jgi:hypothetical protein
MDRVTFDFTGSAVQATGAASASIALPNNAAGKNNLYYLAATANARFRLGQGAQTAVATDPLLQPGFPLYVLAPTGADTIAVIQDTAAGSVTVSRVFEG